MTFLYAIVLAFVYVKTGKKDPVKKLLGKMKGGGDDGSPLAGRKGGGKGGKAKEILLAIWHNVRVLMLFSVILLILASPTIVPLSWFSDQPTIGQVFSVPGVNILSWVTGVMGAEFGGAAVATTILVIAVIAMAADFFCDGKLNNTARNSLLIMPLLALMSIGPIAETMNTANANIRTGASSSVSWIWGGQAEATQR